MGEYATNPKNGKRIKLGTCEDLMYVTRADLEALAATGWKGDGSTEVVDYLECKVSRVALPASSTDLVSAGDASIIDDRKPDPEGCRINLDRDGGAARIIAEDVEHGTLTMHKHGVNFMLPCPMSKAWTPGAVKCSGMPAPWIQFCMEGLNPRRAVFRCPWCGHKFNLHGSSAMPEVEAAFVSQWGEMVKWDGPRYRYLLDLLRAGMTEPQAV